jgi:aromatic-L-amino-acid/L-tryptophan decarboxylase
VAIVAARSLYTSRNPNVKLEDLVIYTTTQTHSLGVKAGLVLGLECRALDVTPEDNFALRGQTLRKAIQADTARGKHPFVLGMPHNTMLSRNNDRQENSRNGRHNVFRGHRPLR